MTALVMAFCGPKGINDETKQNGFIENKGGFILVLLVINSQAKQIKTGLPPY